jgi:hypothetical protein
MQDHEMLDYLPLWALFALTVVAVLLSLEAGFRLGKYRCRRREQEKEAPVGVMVGATLGLLGFLLAFTFGLAATRHDARRQVVLDEANAIGTAYLRAGLLPERQRDETRRLLREYVDVRIEAIESGEVSRGQRRSAELHVLLWAQATTAAEKEPRSIVVGLFIQALNDVINLHAKRVTLGMRNRLPGTIWAALYFVAVLSMAAMGYQAGLAGTTRSLAEFAVALTFSGVLFLVADLDRPQEGLLRVSQQALVDVRRSMQSPAP